MVGGPRGTGGGAAVEPPTGAAPTGAAPLGAAPGAPTGAPVGNELADGAAPEDWTVGAEDAVGEDAGGKGGWLGEGWTDELAEVGLVDSIGPGSFVF